MKEQKNLHDQLEAVYGTMPEAFHHRVQETLDKLSAQPANAVQSRRPKLRWGVVLAAALLLATAIGAAATLSRTLGWITHTAADNWVLEEAEDLLHTDGLSTQINGCAISLKEWLCDGERLYVCVSVSDPELQNSENRDPEALRRCAARYSLGAVRLSAGKTSGGMTWDYEPGDEPGEILYIIEQSIEGVPDAFEVSIPVYAPEGECSVGFRVTQADRGRIREFAPSPVLQAQGYTAQITRLRATALRTYGELTLTFDPSLPMEKRREIVNGYMDGLGVPEGRLDVTAGEGEEILLPHTAQWAEDGLLCAIQLDGNPRETYPAEMVYCPRWQTGEEEEQDTLPPLSMEGAVVMEIRERNGEQR